MNPQTRRLLSFTAAVFIALIGLSMAAGQRFALCILSDIEGEPAPIFLPPLTESWG